MSNATRIVIGKLANQNGCAVAFRGSDNVYNFIRDAQFWTVHPFRGYKNCDRCQVHSGFYDVWENLRDQVAIDLAEVGCTPNPIDPDNLLYVTGHSLGAALTHLAMFTLHDDGFKVAESYSFEAPRVGNTAFSETFSKRFTRKFPVFRITHRWDPVVHLPPTELGFTHVQQEVYYNSTDQFQMCPDVEDLTCADQYNNVPWMTWEYSGDHCASPLVPNGNICNPVGCVNTRQVMV
jgi:predicted lipase